MLFHGVSLVQDVPSCELKPSVPVFHGVSLVQDVPSCELKPSERGADHLLSGCAHSESQNPKIIFYA